MRAKPFGLLLLLLTGCMAPGAKPGSTDDAIEPLAPPQFADDEGALVGRVVDDEQIPIANASLRLLGGPATNLQSSSPLKVIAVGNPETRTSPDGRFQFNHLDPGIYSLLGEAEGHQPAARGLEIRSGEVTSVVLTLAPIPPAYVPHMKQGPVWNGYLACSLGLYAITLADVCASADSNANSSTTVRFEKHLNAVHWEMRWQSSAALSARYLSLLFASPPLFQCAHWGASPVVKDCSLGKNSTANPYWDRNNTQSLPQVRAKGNHTVPNANSVGTWATEQSGPVLQQRFKVYWTFFYGGMDIPPGFRNSPDS